MTRNLNRIGSIVNAGDRGAGRNLHRTFLGYPSVAALTAASRDGRPERGYCKAVHRALMGVIAET